MNNIRVVCPEIFPNIVWNEAEVLGAMTWLWFQDKNRHKITFEQVMSYLLHPINSGQFVVFYEANKPIGFISWALMSKLAEDRYLDERCVLATNPEYWSNGNNLWIIDFFAPFGNRKKIHDLLKNTLFPNTICRGMSRRVEKLDRSLCYTYRGKNISDTEFKSWLNQNPISTKEI